MRGNMLRGMGNFWGDIEPAFAEEADALLAVLLRHPVQISDDRPAVFLERYSAIFIIKINSETQRTQRKYYYNKCIGE